MNTRKAIVGKTEAANKVILKELKKRVREGKGIWDEEFLAILWAYRYTLQSTIGETPF